MPGGANDAIEPVAMLTTEVAELTGKAHRHVMRDARAMIAELHGEQGLPRFGQTYPDSQGKPQPCLRLPERELLVLLTGYSVPLRAKVIDRMRQLEAERQHAKPRSPYSGTAPPSRS